MNMKDKILIIGCCGAGKTKLAKQIAEITKLPLIHLDKEYYKPHWEKPAKEEWEKKVLEMVSSPHWIMDGNYYNSMDIRLSAADTVIFLDINRVTCIMRIFKRMILPSEHCRPDMAADCRERIDIDFIRYVWNFNKTMRPRILELLKYHNDIDLIVLKNNREIRDFLAGIQAKK
jgi:adenylate kinase family enzyme